MDKQTATQSAVNAVAVATQAINDYGPASPEACGAFQTAKDSVTTARAHGATDTDLRTTRPA